MGVGVCVGVTGIKVGATVGGCDPSVQDARSKLITNKNRFMCLFQWQAALSPDQGASQPALRVKIHPVKLQCTLLQLPKPISAEDMPGILIIQALDRDP